MRTPLLTLVAITGLLTLGVTSTLAQQPAAKPLEILMDTLGKVDSPESQANILRGLNAALKGRRDVAVPAAWAPLYARLKGSANEEVRRQAQALAVTFGGESALAEMRRTLGDRTAAIAHMVAARPVLRRTVPPVS